MSRTSPACARKVVVQRHVSTLTFPLEPNTALFPVNYKKIGSDIF